MLNDMNKPENSAKWSKERFDAELEKGYNDMLNGRTTPCRDGPFRYQKEIQKNRSTGLDYASCD
jgi:hypothetical protein